MSESPPNKNKGDIKMIGIYKYTNKINGHIYIGQSINIEERQYQHKHSAYYEKAKDYNSQFHQAIRKYGLENFDFEVIAELSPEEYTRDFLNELEKYYIKYYNSFNNGYNATEGGDDKIGSSIHQGSKNGRAKLTEEDVEYIRECYNSHIPFREVFAEYEDKISKRGLQKIWWFETWKNIHPEYHNEENKYYHSHQAKANSYDVASNNQRCFIEEQVKQMREAYDNGMTPKEVWQKFAPQKAWSTVYNAITRHTYQDIQ